MAGALPTTASRSCLRRDEAALGELGEESTNSRLSKPSLEDPVAHQVDLLGQPLHGHTVVVGEAGHDEDHPWPTPVDRLVVLRAQYLPVEPLGLVLCRAQPGQVRDSL